MNPLISIIVPVYNVEKYVLKCLKSLSCQIYENIEIIIVDDGATDKSGKICDDFVKSEKRARIFHKKNGGLSSARNFGLEKAKGDIVAFVDSDDYVKNNYISEMYKEMTADHADIVVCGYNNDIPKKEIISGEDSTVRLLTKQDNVDLIVWNKLYKKSLFNGVTFPVGKKHEDTLTTYKLLSKAKIVTYLDESLYNYIERKGSITETEGAEERLSMREQAADEAIEYFKNRPKLKYAAEICLLWAKYNFLNNAISGEIDRRFTKECLDWLKQNADSYRDNEYMTKKLTIYNFLSTKLGGILYILFRKIIRTKV